MPADQARVLKRVTEILNLCDPGTYSSTLSTRNKTRNATAIADFTTEAGLIVLRTLAESPNEYRAALTNVVTLTHQQVLPEHQGPPSYVEIQRYSGAGWRQADRRDYRKIESYIANPSLIYDAIAHNIIDSTLSGYYDIWQNRFYFTGFAARAGLAQVLRTDVTTKVPEVFENTWIRLAVGQSAKSGTGNYDMSMASYYGREGMADIQEFKTGKRRFREVSDPKPIAAIHEEVLS